MAREEKCPECGSKRLRKDIERGEVYCLSCGLVLEESTIFEGPDWRAFDAEQRVARTRAGAPLKYMAPHKGLVTEIDQYNRDIRGGRIAPSQQAQLYRIRKWHKRATISDSVERNLAIAITELNRVATLLGLDESVREASALLYRRALERGVVRGRPIESTVSAVLYAVCRQYEIPRTLDEISAMAKISKKEIGRTYRLILRGLELKLPIASPVSYVSRFITALRLGGEVQERAIEVINNAMRTGVISGRGPLGVAAAAVYIACLLTGIKKTQREIADVAGITEVTIRNRYRELRKSLRLETPL